MPISSYPSAQTLNQQLKVYWVFDPDQTSWPTAQLWDLVEATLAAGVTMVQWRAPKRSSAHQYEDLLKLKPLCQHYNIPLIINDNVALALAVDANGVHVGQNDMHVTEARTLMGKGKIIGLSTHSQAEIAAIPPDTIDYIGIGPIWPTISKADAATAIGPEGLRSVSIVSSYPAVAIGGINLNNIDALRNCTIAGVAVISAISRQSDPAQAVMQLKNKCDLLFNNSSA